jgi:hypothetical protein
MAKALMVVGANPPDPALEAAFNEWYTEQHLDDVLAVAVLETFDLAKFSVDFYALMPGSERTSA